MLTSFIAGRTYLFSTGSFPYLTLNIVISCSLIKAFFCLISLKTRSFISGVSANRTVMNSIGRKKACASPDFATKVAVFSFESSTTSSHPIISFFPTIVTTFCPAIFSFLYRVVHSIFEIPSLRYELSISFYFLNGLNFFMLL